METTTCPECDAPAEIRGRSVWESTDGPIEHIRVECIRRHWFLMSVESLAAAHRQGVARTAADLADLSKGVSRRPSAAPTTPGRRDGLPRHRGREAA